MKKTSHRREASRRRRLLLELRRVTRALQRVSPHTFGRRWTEMLVQVKRMQHPRPWWTPPTLEKIGFAADGTQAKQEVPLGPLLAHTDPFRARTLTKDLRRSLRQSDRELPIRRKNAIRRSRRFFAENVTLMNALNGVFPMSAIWGSLALLGRLGAFAGEGGGSFADRLKETP